MKSLFSPQGGETLQDARETSYPFMDETELLCDYEILTDGLSSYLGLALSQTKTEDYPQQVAVDLKWLSEMVLHLNGSIRGQLAINQSELKLLNKKYDFYKKKVKHDNFTLPGGDLLAAQIDVCRYKSKEVVRLLNKLKQNKIEIDDILFSFANILANLLYLMSLYINDFKGIKQEKFKSKSY